MDKTENFLQSNFNSENFVQQLKLDEMDLIKLNLLIEYRLLQNKRFFKNLCKSNQKLPDKDKNLGNNRCLARIHSGNQCSRKCKTNDVTFCGSHLHSLPYGRIDMKPQNSNKLIEKKTRGRKSKNKSYIELDQIDLTHYIKTEIIEISGCEYLIDENGVLFENNNINTIVGIKVGENYTWL